MNNNIDLFKRIRSRISQSLGDFGGNFAQSGGAGQVCFDSDNFLFFIGILCVLGLALVYFFRNKTFENLQNQIKNISSKPINVQIIKEFDPNPQQVGPQVGPQVGHGDGVVEHVKYPRELNDPYVPPQRYYDMNRLGLNLPFNIPTRGYDDGLFQKVGFINSKKHRLPLFGKRMYPGSDRWEYYVEDDSRHKNKIDITCQGNKELYDRDTVPVPGYKREFDVHIYEYSQPRYSPNILF